MVIELVVVLVMVDLEYFWSHVIDRPYELAVQNILFVNQAPKITYFHVQITIQ